MRTLHKPNLAFYLIVILLAALCLTSCSNYAKKLSKATPITTKDSTMFASKCNELFPVKEKFVQGKPITKVVTKLDTKKVSDLQKKIDDLIDQNITLASLIDGVPNIDSLKKSISKQVAKDCQPIELFTTINTVDTIYKVDSTILFIQRAKIDELTTDNQKLRDKVDKRNKQLIWLYLALAVSLVYIFRNRIIGGLRLAKII